MFTILYFFFFFNDTATTEIYTLSLHDALPIFRISKSLPCQVDGSPQSSCSSIMASKHFRSADRKSTRLNSSHLVISYAVFCLKKKKTPNKNMNSAEQMIIMRTSVLTPVTIKIL